jgi:starch synthase
MRVAILSSEVVPFAKTGGLADVAGALPKALRTHHVDAIAILPLHDQVGRDLLNSTVIDGVSVEWRGRIRPTRVWQSDAGGFPAYLIEAPEYFARQAIYGHGDDHERFAFFSRAALELFKRLDWRPDIVQGNDWPCGFAIVELRKRRLYEEFFKHSKSVMSIHNLAYQGIFDPKDLWWLGFDDPADRDDFILRGMASSLKAGIIAADALTTVSPKYAQEIQTPEQGNGLDWLLRARSSRLVGITNAVDYEVWNPETDPHIAAHFSVNDLSGKRDCKEDLLRRFGLDQNLEPPIVAIISRLVRQKGYDLIRETAAEIIRLGCRVVALGAGETQYEMFLQRWHDSSPKQVGIYVGYAGEALAHQIEAGADIFLMPSLYEPCGLNQMYSMRYGTVPIVRATGGLDDTVQNFDPKTDTGTGFKFHEYGSAALLDKIQEALYFYGRPQQWQKIQKNGMSVDNSWTAAAAKYLEFYQHVINL